MYKNLAKAMKDEGITHKQIGEMLDCKYQTISDKIKGITQTGFTYDEAVKIKKVFFPKYDIEYLFYREINITTKLA